MKTIIFILMLLSFWGCSGGQGTNTTLSVSRSFVVGGQAGGLMVYITNKTKNTTSAISLQSTTKTITLEHGEYNFKAVGWDGAEVMQGNLLCGEATANLKDPKATVEINILKNNCETGSFVPAAYKATGGVATLQLISCVDLGLINAYGDTCTAGPIGSYRVRLASFELDSSINPNIGLTSPCIPAQPVTNTDIKLPYGSSSGSFATTIETFSDGNCSSGKEQNYYPFGLAFAASTGSFSEVYTNGYFVNFYAQRAPSLLTVTPITISSSNPNSVYAKVNDTVFLNFTANRTANFSVKINNNSVTVSNPSGATYSASYVLTASDQPGVVNYEISAEGATFVQTTNLSQVTFIRDVSTPTLTLVGVDPSINPTPSFVVSNITSGSSVSLYSDDTCTNLVSSDIASATTHTLTSSPLTPGSYQFSSKQTDIAGNVSTCSNSVNYMFQTINITNIQSTSSNPNATFAKASDTIHITFTSNFLASFTANVNGMTVPVTNIGGTDYQLNYIVTPGDPSGNPLLDISANGTSIITGQPLSGIIIDTVIPSTPLISRFSPTENASHSTTLQISANGLESGGIVKIYNDPACSSVVTQANTGASSMNLTVSGLMIQQYQFYTRQYDQAGNASLCSSALPYRVKAPFISIWRTTTAPELITLPLPASGFTYNYKVDWGDGSAVTTHTDNNAYHSYSTPGDYTVKITGTIEAWSFNGLGSKNNILEVTDFGEMGWKNLYGAFKGCQNLTTFNGGVYSLVTDMGSMFSQAPLVTPNTTNWDTSKVTNMASLFYEADAAQPNTTNWDVSKVTTMSSMFEGANVANPSTGAWNTAALSNTSKMFKNAPMANPNTSLWNMSAVTVAYEMFYAATNANPDVSNWNTASMTQMDRMFYNAAIATPNTTTWDTSNVTAMTSMFEDAILANPDTSNWNLSAVVNLDNIFTNSGIQKTNWSKFLVMASATANAPNASIYVNAPHDSTGVTPKADLETNLNWTIDDQGLQP